MEVCLYIHRNYSLSGCVCTTCFGHLHSCHLLHHSESTVIYLFPANVEEFGFHHRKQLTSVYLYWHISTHVLKTLLGNQSSATPSVPTTCPSKGPLCTIFFQQCELQMHIRWKKSIPCYASAQTQIMVDFSYESTCKPQCLRPTTCRSVYTLS